MSRLKSSVGYRLRIASNRFRSLGRPKIFCVGRNKTGTTSLKLAFQGLHLPVGDQRAAEKLYDARYWKGDFEAIVRYCKMAQAYQDVPFSVPKTYEHLDLAFPTAKFILTVRDSAGEWYESLVRFHSAGFGQGTLPTASDLKMATYVRPGWMYDNFKRLYGTPDDDLYNRAALEKHYADYNASVISHFSDRPQKLLILNLAEPTAWDEFIGFLGIAEPRISEFPHANRSR